MPSANTPMMIAAGLIFLMFVAVETGWRVGKRRQRIDAKGAHTGVAAADSAIFALFGLLIAFTFSGAAQRFDARRHLVVEETNAIGTAWLRIDTLAPEDQPALRAQFREYLAIRVQAYKLFRDLPAAFAELDRAARMQDAIWKTAMDAGRREGYQQANMILLPALNQMFDIVTTRTAAMQFHPPQIIFAMLFVLAVASSLLVGDAMSAARSRPWLHMFAFVIVTACAIYVIVDLEYPRLGLIRVDATDRLLEDLLKNMTPKP